MYCMSLKNSLKIVLLLFVFTAKMSFAQTEKIAEVSLKSPYNTIFTHLYFLQDDSYFPAKSAQAIQGNISLVEKEKIAIKIKKVLDGRGLYIEMGLLPINNNYIDSTLAQNVYILSSKEPLIYLEKIDTSWYYSQTTILNIDKLYKDVYPFWITFIDKIISNKVSDTSFLGIRIWQYVAMIILVAISFLLYYLVRIVSFFCINNLLLPKFQDQLPNKDILFKIAKALGLVVTFFFIGKVLPSLQIPLKFSVVLILANQILLIFFIAFFMSKLFKLIMYYLGKAADKTDTKLDNQLLPIVENIVNFIIYFTAIIFVLKELDVNVTALLAGLSVGGLALALASKDTVQNVIGSLNIFLDRPFEIGDYISVSGAEGEVEEVGLRATRIRTLDQAVAYIPNGVLSNMTIDNYGLRVYRRWTTSFGIDYNTSPDLISFFVEESRKIINAKDFTLSDKTMVYFNNLGASTLDIYVSVFFDVASFRDDLNSKQVILLEILQMAKDNKIEFAFPTQTVYRK